LVISASTWMRIGTRWASTRERDQGFHNNAHLKRENPEVDLLIHGGAGL
jgi:hypothetical protein